MSTPLQVDETETSVRGLRSEPGTRPVEQLRAALNLHWPENAMEAALLGFFMLTACLFTVILQFPESPARQAISSPTLRRALTGVGMGITAVALIYSPWGQRSGAHINPSVTRTFLRLGKIGAVDAAFYFLFQFAGAAIGVLIATAALGPRIADPAVQYAATHPGPAGSAIASLGEFVISFLQMTMVLFFSNHPRLHWLTGLDAGVMVALYIFIESPQSGVSMNPARTFGSALPSGIWHGFLIYFLVPPAAMLAAAQAFVWRKGKSAVHSCKLDHTPAGTAFYAG